MKKPESGLFNYSSSLIHRLISSKSIGRNELKFVDRLPISNDLEITGRGTDLVVISEQAPLENLHVGGVLDELLNLILRLEFQRKRAELLLEKEKIALERLKSEIERLALKRARDLPVKVQSEHDACITDITELNWHISFNQKTERKLLRRCELGERLDLIN